MLNRIKYFTSCIYPVNFWLVLVFIDSVTCYHIGIVKLSVSKPNTKLVNGDDQWSLTITRFMVM